MLSTVSSVVTILCLAGRITRVPLLLKFCCCRYVTATCTLMMLDTGVDAGNRKKRSLLPLTLSAATIISVCCCHLYFWWWKQEENITRTCSSCKSEWPSSEANHLSNHRRVNIWKRKENPTEERDCSSGSVSHSMLTALRMRWKSKPGERVGRGCEWLPEKGAFKGYWRVLKDSKGNWIVLKVI